MYDIQIEETLNEELQDLLNEMAREDYEAEETRKECDLHIKASRKAFRASLA